MTPTIITLLVFAFAWLIVLSIKLFLVSEEDTEAGLHLCRRINDVEHAGEMRLKQFDIANRETMARIQQVESGQLIARNDILQLWQKIWACLPREEHGGDLDRGATHLDDPIVAAGQQR